MRHCSPGQVSLSYHGVPHINNFQLALFLAFHSLFSHLFYCHYLIPEIRGAAAPQHFSFHLPAFQVGEKIHISLQESGEI